MFYFPIVFFNVKITLLNLSFKSSKIFIIQYLKKEKENIEIPGHRLEKRQ